MVALNEERILGVPVDAVTLDEAVSQLISHLEMGEHSIAVAVNPEKVLAARENPWLLRFLEGAALRIPDGVGIVWASRRKGGAVHTRVTGIDLFLAVAKKAAEKNWSLYLLGAQPGVAEAAGVALQEKFSGLRVAGSHDGYFSLDAGRDVADAVRLSGAEVLFVAMGSPRQEHWLFEYFDATGTTLAMGVGGGFDVVSGRVRRAPALIRSLGLEWLFRFLLQPKARYKRVVKLFRFAWEVLRES